MFNNISGTYDFLNHFLSLGIDVIWRKKAIRELLSDKPKYILDVATGTGDFAFEAIKILKPEKIIGVDISEGMLAIAKEKILKRKMQDIFEVRIGDSERLVDFLVMLYHFASDDSGIVYPVSVDVVPVELPTKPRLI